MAVTSRGLHYPAYNDVPNVHSDIQQLALDVDAEYATVATDADLPAPGIVGTRIRSATSGTLWLDIGTAWVRESSAPGRGAALDYSGVTPLTMSGLAYGQLGNGVEQSVLPLPLHLPNRSLILLGLRGLWKINGAGGDQAHFCLHMNGVSVKREDGGGTAWVDAETLADPATGDRNKYAGIYSYGGGVLANVTSGASVSDDPGTGSVFVPAGGASGGLCPLFANAGDYVISLRAKTTGGATVTVADLKMWAWVVSPNPEL